MVNERNGTSVDQDICSYCKEALAHAGCLKIKWTIGHQQMNKPMFWDPVKLQHFHMAYSPKMLIHFFYTPPNLNLQNQPDLM